MPPPKIRKFQQLQPGDAPVIPSLSSRMGIELLINDSGKALLLHREKLPVLIWWAEYDVEMNSLYFVTVDAQLMPYGMKLTPILQKYILACPGIVFCHVPKDPETGQDSKDVGLPMNVPLVIRHAQPLDQVRREMDVMIQGQQGAGQPNAPGATTPGTPGSNTPGKAKEPNMGL